MARTDKTAVLADLEAGFRESSAALLTEYRGLTVAQLKQLRRSLAGDAEYAVVKNTLTKLAAERAGVAGLDDLLVGPSAVAFVSGDAINAAKALKAFAKENPRLVIKGGYYEGKVISAAEVMKLADLESREVLLSKVAGVMLATLAKAVRTVDALRIKLEEGVLYPPLLTTIEVRFNYWRFMDPAVELYVRMMTRLGLWREA